LHYTSTDIYWTHAELCDDVRVVRHNLAGGTDFNDYSVTTFIEGTGVDEYHRVNSEVTRFQLGGFSGIMIIFAVNPAKRAINPAKLVDTVASTVISNIPLWHPAKGHHYDVALHNIDIQSDADPAGYAVTLDTNDLSSRAWNSQEVGKVWLDTSWLGYLPYYDSVIMPNVNDRLYAWGKLAPWADAKVYKWVKSSVAPTDYAALVTAQSTDTTIAQNDRASGTARSTVFKCTRATDVGAYGSWTKQPLVVEKLFGAYDIPAAPTLQLHSSYGWAKDDVADVYKNGILIKSGIVVSSGLTITVTTSPVFTVTENDIVTVVRPIHVPSAVELAYVPADHDGVTAQWTQSYEYTTDVVSSGSLSSGIVDTTSYYFWVENSTSRNTHDNTSLSPFEVELQLITIPTPYFVVQKPVDDPTLVAKYGYGLMQFGGVFSLGQLADQFLSVPVLYRQAIIRHASNYITDDNRFIVRFTRDFTLRDDQLADGTQMNLKDKHEKWYLFREKQQNTVPVELWNRLIEAMIGYTLADSTVRVPSLARELYDASTGSNTRYGLGVDQAFVDKNLAISTIVSYLEDPANNFYPLDIDNFFVYNNFNSPAAIQSAMNTIYTTFPANHVNAIWFSTLRDALTTKPKYKELMKTSWIALHGIRVLEVGGLFDD
jgi:hypothetical protein